MKTLLVPLVISSFLATLQGCTGVRQQGLDSWINQPIAALEAHPFFRTAPIFKTIAADDTEIWIYKNDDGCNNIFYIKDGKVLRYIAENSGGMWCNSTQK